MRLSEINSVVKRKFKISVGLLFPSSYQASLSSLALQILYFYLNQHKDIFAERLVMDVNGGLRSLETGRPLNKFDYILVLSSYELDYPSAVGAISRGGLAPLRTDRRGPVVIWGGPSPTANPWPLYHFADAVLRGEAESFLDKLIERMVSSSDRESFLESLSEITEAWIPEVKEESTIGRVSNLDEAFFPVRQIQSLDVEPFLGRAFILEPSRGCARGCRFCLEFAVLGHRRERSLNRLISYIDNGIEANRVDKVAFYTLSFFDSPSGERLLEYLIERGLSGSIPSVRADSLDEYRVELVRKAGQRVLTIAPETPSDRLQLLINKKISQEAVLNVAEWCRKAGLFIKLYYMYGLPGEEEEDLELIVNQVKQVRDIMGSLESVRVSIVPFTPKPMTLMWREGMMDLRELKRRERLLRRKIRMYARVESYPPKLSRAQYEINLMGRDAREYILRLANISGKDKLGLESYSSARGLEEVG